jgi:O-methyltransferase involved in polyketide biosynthesis
MPQWYGNSPPPTPAVTMHFLSPPTQLHDHARFWDQTSIAVRSKAFDRCAEDFLDRYPVCTVLHLGCGLDARIHRLRPPETVCWYDIDLPDVIELRRRFYPDRDGSHTIGRSVTDPHVFDQAPADKPVLVVAEGLTPYLRAADGVAMLRRIVGRFPCGEIVFDGYTRAGVWLIRRVGLRKVSGAQVDWSIDDPRDLEEVVSGLIFDAEWPLVDKSDLGDHYSWLSRQLLRAMSATLLGRVGRGLSYHF